MKKSTKSFFKLHQIMHNAYKIIATNAAMALQRQSMFVDEPSVTSSIESVCQTFLYTEKQHN